MADGRSPDVVVVGGAAGAVIAHKLGERGKRVALLCRTDVAGSTDTNQKWLHSGLLYPSGGLAARAWKSRNSDWTVKQPYLHGPEEACILALSSRTIADREGLWAKWKAEGRDVPEARPLSTAEKSRFRSLGITFEGGWSTPDCVIDFPALVRDMRLNLEGKLQNNAHLPSLKERGQVMEGARVLRLRRGRNGIEGVDVDWNGDQWTLSCQQLVLAAGAWSHELLGEIGVRLPLIRKRCLVLAAARASLPIDKITVCLDVTKADGTSGDVTLVPFHDKTLAAGTDFKVVYNLRDRPLEALTHGPSEIQGLIDELSQCFRSVEGLARTDYEVRTCFKTEQYNPSHPDVDLKVYTHRAGGARHEAGHDVEGLIVALPGKASLMFDLAREVAPLIS